MRTESYPSKGNFLFMRKSARASAGPISMGKTDNRRRIDYYGRRILNEPTGNFARRRGDQQVAVVITLRIIHYANVIFNFPIGVLFQPRVQPFATNYRLVLNREVLRKRNRKWEQKKWKNRRHRGGRS